MNNDLTPNQYLALIGSRTISTATHGAKMISKSVPLLVLFLQKYPNIPTLKENLILQARAATIVQQQDAVNTLLISLGEQILPLLEKQVDLHKSNTTPQPGL